MQVTDRKSVLKDSLIAMKNSLTSSYFMKTRVTEESGLLKAWADSELDYVVFSDYRRNEGNRRLKDIVEVIDTAVESLEDCTYQTASKLYLETLTTVAMYTKWACVLEKQSNGL
ncbi:MAG: hypothetical protein ACTSUO_05370 [Candidatus Thorarchaeota archaeon]